MLRTGARSGPVFAAAEFFMVTGILHPKRRWRKRGDSGMGVSIWLGIVVWPERERSLGCVPRSCVVALKFAVAEERRTGGIAYATKGKFVSNRKLFLLCFHWKAHENNDFVRFTCIE
jgi:hypothetical protein